MVNGEIPIDRAPLVNFETFVAREEWKEWEKHGPVWAIRKGMERGYPTTSFVPFAKKTIEGDVLREDYLHAYNFGVYCRKNGLDVGLAEEDVRNFGVRAYESFIEDENFPKAMGIAEAVYGRDSDEWRRANDENLKRLKKLEGDQKVAEEIYEEDEPKVIELPKDATFKDLFDCIDELEGDEVGSLGFEKELLGHFNKRIVKRVIYFQENPEAAARNRVLTFFGRRGYGRSDVEAFLPIKFVEKKNKKRE